MMRFRVEDSEVLDDSTDAPDRVLFGRKDAQQAFLVRTMVADLDFPVIVDVVETHWPRERDSRIIEHAEFGVITKRVNENLKYLFQTEQEIGRAHV